MRTVNVKFEVGQKVEYRKANYSKMGTIEVVFISSDDSFVPRYRFIGDGGSCQHVDFEHCFTALTKGK